MRVNTKAATVSGIARKFKRQEATLLSFDLPRFPHTHNVNTHVWAGTHTHTQTHTHAIPGSTIL